MSAKTDDTIDIFIYATILTVTGFLMIQFITSLLGAISGKF